MDKPKDVLEHNIDVGDIVVAHMCSHEYPIIKGRAYKVNSILDNSHIEVLDGDQHLKIYSAYFLKIASGLENINVNLDAVATKIQTLINSKPWSPTKEEIVAALK